MAGFGLGRPPPPPRIDCPATYPQGQVLKGADGVLSYPDGKILRATDGTLS